MSTNLSAFSSPGRLPEMHTMLLKLRITFDDCKGPLDDVRVIEDYRTISMELKTILEVLYAFHGKTIGDIVSASELFKDDLVAISKLTSEGTENTAGLYNVWRHFEKVLDGLAQYVLMLSRTEPNEHNSGASWHANYVKNGGDDYFKLRDALEELIEEITRSNSLSTNPALEGFRREQLLQMLRTIIVLLEAPLIDTALVSKTHGKVRELGEAMVAEGAKTTAREVVRAAKDALLDFLTNIMSGGGGI